MEFPYLANSEIDAAAMGLLGEAFGKSILYPIDLDAIVYDCLCEGHGVVFRDQDDLRQPGQDEVLGRMRPLANTIEVSSHLAADGQVGRYRFTVAHEIGHWVLHRPLFEAARDQADLFAAAVEAPPSGDLVSLKRNVFPRPGVTTPREEIQANRFAIALLIGGNELRNAYRSRFGPRPLVLGKDHTGSAQMSLRALSRRAAKTPDTSGTAMRDVFGVSTEALAIALETRGYVVPTPPVL